MAVFLLGLWVALAPAVLDASAAIADQTNIAGEFAADHCGSCSDAERDGNACALLCASAFQLALVGERSELARLSRERHRFSRHAVLRGRALEPDFGPPRRVALR